MTRIPPKKASRPRPCSQREWFSPSPSPLATQRERDHVLPREVRSDASKRTPPLRRRIHSCRLGTFDWLEDRTLLSGTANNLLASIATRIELGTPSTGTIVPGEVAFFRIDPTTEGRLVGRVHAE